MAREEFYLVDDREVVLTPDMHVKCDGGNGVLGHPMEYMTLEKGGTVTCKYCGRQFIHESHADARSIRESGVAQAAA